jgi:hypothetical protein
MKTFKFNIDVKHTAWERQYYEFEAQNEIVARDLLIEKLEDYNWLEDHFRDTETLYDTMDEMRPSENQGNATRELYFENDRDFLCDNSIKQDE